MSNFQDAGYIVKQNYYDFAKYSMIAKSYPSVYDGLTEVRRRCLVGAFTEAPATSMVKLSTMAGYILSYHPHSSDGIAEVIVNMTSEYTCPFPMFDGRGNYGDLSNPASAPRYLECKLKDITRKLYFKFYEEAPKENYEVREEPLFLPTLFPAALLTSQFLIGNGTPNCLIPGLEFDDLRRYILNYIETGETLVNEDNFVRLVDYDQVRDWYRDESIMNLLNTGKGTITYEPNVEVVGNQIIISNLYVLAQFSSLVEFLKEAIEDDKVDVRDESTTDRVWVVEKVRYHSFDMAAWAEKLKKKFTYRENYAMYFHDGEKVRPYSLGEVIDICYGKYREAYLAQMNKELDAMNADLVVLQCLADIVENKRALGIVTNNTMEDDDKISVLTELLPDYTQNVIKRCLDKPIRQLKADYKAIAKLKDKIKKKQDDISDVDSVIYDVVEKL